MITPRLRLFKHGILNHTEYFLTAWKADGCFMMGIKPGSKIRTAELETEEAQWSLVVEEQKALRQLIEHFFNALNSQIELYFLRGIDRLIRERLVIYEKQVKSGIQIECFSIKRLGNWKIYALKN